MWTLQTAMWTLQTAMWTLQTAMWIFVRKNEHCKLQCGHCKLQCVHCTFSSWVKIYSATFRVNLLHDSIVNFTRARKYYSDLLGEYFYYNLILQEAPFSWLRTRVWFWLRNRRNLWLRKRRNMVSESEFIPGGMEGHPVHRRVGPSRAPASQNPVARYQVGRNPSQLHTEDLHFYRYFFSNVFFASMAVRAGLSCPLWACPGPNIGAK